MRREKKVMTRISEVNLQFIKPTNGLVAFASLVLDDDLYLGSIAIHERLDGLGYRLTYPTKRTDPTRRPLFHPINRKTSSTIEGAIFTKLKEVMRNNHAGHHRIDIDEG